MLNGFASSLFRLFTHRCLPRTSGCALIAVITLCTGCGQADSSGDEAASSGAAQDRDATPVLTEAVSWRDNQTLIQAVGTSRAIKSVTLYPQVSGEVTQVNYDAGEYVQANQILFQLDDRDEQLALALANVELSDAQRLLRRYRQTSGAGSVTQAMLDDAKSAVARAQIAVDRAQVAVEDHRVRAPFAGFAGLTDIEPGARVEPGVALTTLDDRSHLLVSFAVPELFHGQLSPDEQVQVRPWTAGSQAFPGEILEIDSRISPSSRTFQVRAQVANQHDRLRPGMSFKVDLNLASGRYPVVPEVALQWGGDGAYVWAVRDGQARRVASTVVQRLPGRILIDAPLPEGTQVVTEGIQNVREGAPVTNVEAALGSRQ